MGLTSPRRTRVAWVALALVAIAAAVDAGVLWRLQRQNAAIAANAVPAEPPADAPREWRFAAAVALAASGAGEAALQRYRGLQDDTALGRAARFNSANLLMRQAFALRAGLQPGQAIAPIELAKEMYREILRDAPEHWGARYNLERAQRLLPEPDDADTAAPDAARNAERAATTMRGYSPGLP